MSSNFIHFRTQSSYSMLESTIRLNKLIELTKNHDMPAVCLADRGNLFASLEFALSACKAGIQPIHGAILNLRLPLENKLENKLEFTEILLIAKDQTGWQNLLKLVSYSFIKNDRKICNHISFADLEDYNEGIIVLSGYTKGIIGQLLSAKEIELANKIAADFGRIFKDRFYFEISRHGLEIEKQIEEPYLRIAADLSIPLIATNEVLFDDASMHDAHDVLLCISQGLVREQLERKRVSNQCYFKSSREMMVLFSDLPEAITNTVYLAKRCSVMAESHPPILPSFIGNLAAEEKLIRTEANTGLKEKLKIKYIVEKIPEQEQEKIRQKYQQRLDYELDIICRMNFSGYFLIVSDFIKWSKKNGIAVGPGRGSGAGSIIAWTLEITNLDPIKFGLLFERFLNPERVSMPDFDIDFCQERREEVITYVQEKYGINRVGQIITFGKMQSKAVIKDVARVLGLGYRYADYLTELVPFNAISPVTLSQAIVEIPELGNAASGKGLYNLQGEDELIAQVLSTALALEGLHRHASTHAAGLVIANCDLIETIPLYKDPDSDMLIVQYSMKYCELAGLLKFDFLGLQTLTVINNCLQLLDKQAIKLDLDKLTFDDTRTFNMLSCGLSTGVFQFESSGMKNALCKLKPDNIEDIIALGALYRPGPMDNIPTFIACKHKNQEVDYLHPLLEPILKSTYGVIVYQEQVMEVAQKLANYSPGSADLLRKAMGKKVQAEMAAQEQIFIKGAKKNGVPTEQAQSIFATVAKFAGYGFNKAHAAAYGVISYQTAYLKANFTAEFLVAALNLDIDNSDKINIFLQEAKVFNIPIIPPCINNSHGLFNISNANNSKSLVFALGAIKNVTTGFGEVVVQERNNRGKFTDIIDFIQRIDHKLINRRLLENIIKAGCFDSLHANRNSLINSVAKLMAYGALYHTEQNSQQFSLIKVAANSKDVLIDAPNLTTSQNAYNEFEVMGLFIKNHPLYSYKEILEQSGISSFKHLSSALENYNNASITDKKAKRNSKSPNYSGRNNSSYVKLAGVIIKKDTRMSERGRFITLILSEPESNFSVSIFSEEVLRNYGHFINVKEAVIVDCEVYRDEGGIRMTAKSFISLKESLKNTRFSLDLYPKDHNELTNLLKVLHGKINSEQEKGSMVNIFLPAESGFTMKINLAQYFSLNGEDITLLKAYEL